MEATYNVGMHSNDFVYILPWIRDGKKDPVPWIGASGEVMKKVRDHYENVIMVHILNTTNFKENEFEFIEWW